jgi:hypothetical protein
MIQRSSHLFASPTRDRKTANAAVNDRSYMVDEFCAAERMSRSRNDAEAARIFKLAAGQGNAWALSEIGFSI